MQIIFTEKDKAKLVEYIQQTVFKDMQVCTIKKHVWPRSNQQNRYLWGVIYSIIAGEIGEDVETVHQICGQKFLSERIIITGDQSPENEETFLVVKSTTKLDTKQFSEYCEAIRHWAWHELNISIPDAASVTEKVMEQIREQYNQGMWVKNFEEDNS